MQKCDFLLLFKLSRLKITVRILLCWLAAQDRSIVAKCPGLARTVPEFRPTSHLCPDWHKIVHMSWNLFTSLELRVVKIPRWSQENPVDVLKQVILKTKT